MQLKKYLTILLLLLLTNVSGCSLLKPKVITVPEIIERNVNIVGHPKPVNLNDVKFYVIVDENFEEFKQKFIKENGDFIVIGISVKGYENLALNIGELRRYIEQQKSIIIYYEDALKTQ